MKFAAVVCTTHRHRPVKFVASSYKTFLAISRISTCIKSYRDVKNFRQQCACSGNGIKTWMLCIYSDFKTLSLDLLRPLIVGKASAGRGVPRLHGARRQIFWSAPLPEKNPAKFFTSTNNMATPLGNPRYLTQSASGHKIWNWNSLL